ncbi:acyl-CoA dehydrogenase family protein [Streptomyces sp. CBMA156]|uniref:acyl-CoA dehydrogenase family protein n=1 Tax=Streptomyces sp. CBMA156 TaxID=1930280 RepID=UPI001661E0FB|nr:acyl-CoA dehydrogenase family protein [Streptomyces sp. CBMA156]MBD0672379.1 acyl-CoA dehydrogenase [Streptomyces sp. CBMA156]
MTHLPAHLEELRRRARGWAVDLRAAALRLDRDPEAVHDLLHLPGVGHLAARVRSADSGDTLERAVLVEELARGDAGLMLASPGPSMAGVLVDVLGSPDQQDWFRDRLTQGPTWTCFALTEPERGSAIGEMSTALTPLGDGSLRLDGAKRYVGNASRASVAAVFARVAGAERLGVTAVLVDTADPGWTAEPLPTLGLRGVRIGAVALDGVHVPADRVLGSHLPPTRRGMWGILAVFNRLRPSVAAIALGIAGAAHDYVAEHRRELRGDELALFEELGRRIHATRLLTHRAAIAVDRRPADGHLASAAKARACELAEDATLSALSFFGPAARLEHPLLDKYARDARGVEFMEGTGTIQRLNLFQGLHTGRVGRAEAC